jgi:60 kDa SS-A/Ro ribonucleoprotein
MKTNVKAKSPPVFTHEGARAVRSSAVKELRRSLMACMLFESGFYESGEDQATRMKGLIKKCSFEEAAQAAIDAREKFKLRHAPLFVVRELLRNHSGRKVGDLIERVIQRADECCELLALYWRDGKEQPLSSQLKIGLARALKKFNEYDLAKWDKPGDIRLRDVLFLTHARPRGADERYTKKERKGKTEFVLNDHEQLFKRLAEDELKTPDTWETELSAGADKKETFTRLIRENKLGALALLRNLRGMLEAGVSEDWIRTGLTNMKTDRVLPFRFISAAKYAPRLEDALQDAMLRCTASLEKLGGKTALLVDHSHSMDQPVSSKSEVTRFDAAAALSMILRETTERCRVFTFANRCVEIPPRTGFGMLAAIRAVRDPTSTRLGAAVRHIYSVFPECDRVIVVTDEQSQDRPPHPQGRGYIINVAGNENGIAYGPWVSIDGWSEAVIDYIRESESDDE